MNNSTETKNQSQNLLSPRKQPSLPDRPVAVQGAKRTLDREDRSDTMKREGGEGDCTKERLRNPLAPDVFCAMLEDLPIW